VLKVIGMIVVLAVVVVLVLAARKPDHFRVQRSASIDAPPERIFPLIKDPDMKRTFSGAGSGRGSIYEWAGNSNVGSGRMEIVESSVPSKVAIKLDFLKPFEGHNIATFRPTPFVGKIMHVFLNMDRMVGTDFEAGLANLKTAAEHEPAGSAS
jgi:hypothetical protein